MLEYAYESEEWNENANVYMEEDMSSVDQDVKTRLIDPIISVLEKAENRNKYIQCGNEFLDANADMLAKEYPTAKVIYPIKYVDKVCDIFGWKPVDLQSLIKDILKPLKEKTTYQTLIASPTNFIHAIALFYSDMILHRQLRDSARQQMGLTLYAITFNRQFRTGIQSIPAMAYTYSTLDNSWGLVRAENVVNWIAQTMDGAYAHARTKMSLSMSLKVLVDFIKDARTRFQQNMRVLSQRYYENLPNDVEIGEDLKGDEEYVETNSTVTYRNNLVRLIRMGDGYYKNKGQLYTAVAQLKNVKIDDLYNFAQKVDYDDISKIMDLIFYIFIIKENHTLDEINSSKYIGRITKFPTAIDRAIPDKPIILPLSKKYKEDSSIVKAYICLIAVYIMKKIGHVKNVINHKT